jgi:hypothetical protein
MIRQPLIRIAIPLALLCAGASLPCPRANGQVFNAQVFDFGQIDSFESMGSGTQRGGAAPKTIVDDADRHTVVITILESNTDAKISWKSADGSPQTTFIHGTTVQAFQIAGLFKIEALGDDTRSVKYGYVLLRLKNAKDRI